MTRVVVVVAIICAAGAWLYWLGGKEAREDLREQIRHSDTLERIGNATTDSRDAGDIDRRLRALAR
ncbi:MULTISPECIES: hypothetical protein [unclassified Sulfitobacter]|jgi:hypothetical protein|uniref:hypothetical protein n=1 Tax=unclassified Sulfitobacter TaxID=196795 RepID=UPI0007C3B381|nr:MULTISPECIES: hypothetical protein [unclassified Sulfitobacter]KZX95924.1 hypothetical protein A3722_16450 [Sulfitobacter sp. HI0027]KZX98075.1 hypothetical protein A3720_16945 [Sulfitobacter sp. HI0021]KZZ02948.1 hypothetical protein A3747_13665 [Sulfitobacter sp. HI0076]|tara:strand:+ start:242 stop:439 length:198 start_codon:yes stop_codon:yes gene_type:complete